MTKKTLLKPSWTVEQHFKGEIFDFSEDQNQTAKPFQIGYKGLKALKRLKN